MNVGLGIAIVAAADAAAIAAMLAIRRRAPEGGYFSDSDRASGVFGVLATGFAIFAGFVVYLAFTSYDQSRAGAESEALTVAQQYETAQFLPAAVRPRLTGQLACYARSVVHLEWPQMKAGATESTLNPWAVSLFRTMKLVEPRTAAEQTAYGKWFDETSDREQARRDRIHGAAGIIPGSLWIVLLLLGGVVVAYVLFYGDPAERAASQAMMIGSATTAVVITLLAVRALDNPYHPGIGSLQPAAMERTLALVAAARTTLGVTTPPPCDAEGAPR